MSVEEGCLGSRLSPRPSGEPTGHSRRTAGLQRSFTGPSHPFGAYLWSSGPKTSTEALGANRLVILPVSSGVLPPTLSVPSWHVPPAHGTHSRQRRFEVASCVTIRARYRFLTRVVTPLPSLVLSSFILERLERKVPLCLLFVRLSVPSSMRFAAYVGTCTSERCPEGYLRRSLGRHSCPSSTRPVGATLSRGVCRTRFRVPVPPFPDPTDVGSLGNHPRLPLRSLACSGRVFPEL